MKNRTREVIESLGIKKVEIARSLGISSVGLQQLLNTEQPKLVTLEHLADAIGVPVWRLILSDEEISDVVNSTKTGAEIFCPHCGNKIRISVECTTP